MSFLKDFQKMSDQEINDTVDEIVDFEDEVVCAALELARRALLREASLRERLERLEALVSEEDL